MALAIIFAIAALAGIIHGIAKKRRSLVIASVIVLIIIATTLLYFYINPY
jgi:hypothetical protein